MRAAYLVPVLFAACSFSGPDGGDGPGAGPGGGNGGGGDGPSACVDDDADTVCNELDDWPCGARSEDPGDEMDVFDLGGGRSWGADDIVIGDARRVVARPNDVFDIDFSWKFRLYCGGQSQCRAQLEIGHEGTRTSCLFDGDVASTAENTGTADTTYRAPAMAGVYEIRLNVGRRSSCGTNGWYGGDPGERSTIAILCVPP